MKSGHLAALASCLTACSGSNLGVPVEPQPEFASAVEVGEPPPPARIEQIAGTPPEAGCSWQDGQWLWRAGWHWQRGAWVRPPEGCYYSLPVMNWVARGTTGALFYRPGRWYARAEARVCPDPPRCGDQQQAPAGAAARTSGAPPL
jgi:hypothetical protein